MKRIGLLSDTHGYIDQGIKKHFANCDEIWHAGDIGNVNVSDTLSAWKPYRAVYGNIDGGNQSQILVTFPTEMRTKPTSIETTGSASNYILRVTSNVTCTSVPQLDNTTTTNALVVPYASSHGFTDKSGAFLRANGDASYLGFAGAEL